MYFFDINLKKSGLYLFYPLTIISINNNFHTNRTSDV